MKSATIVIIVLVIVILLCCMLAACGFFFAFGWLSSQTGNFDFGEPPQTGQFAPDFELQTFDDEVVSFHQFRGQPVMLNFWALWRGPCIEEIPLIQERYQQHNPELVVLAIENESSTVSLGKNVLEARLRFLVLKGTDVGGKQFDIRAYPTSIFVDADGVIRSIRIGSLTGSGIDAELVEIGIGD